MSVFKKWLCKIEKKKKEVVSYAKINKKHLHELEQMLLLISTPFILILNIL